MRLGRTTSRALTLIAGIAIGIAGLSGQASAKYAAIVVDADSGVVLHARNADTRRYPASLTKIMTLYLTFEAIESGRVKLGDRVRFSAKAARQPPSKIGLKKGQSLKVEEAILSLVTKSANDVAVALAEHLAGSEAAFAKRMTERARQLGMKQTTFRNASGLPDTGQRTTARDMVKLALALIKNYPRYYGYFSRKSFRFKGATYRNHNRLLGRYQGIDGIKTGYIRASGFNLVASVNRGGRRLIGVVFGGRSAHSRDNKMRKLIDGSFSRLTKLAKIRPAPIPAHKPLLTQRQAAFGEDDWRVQVGAFDSYTAAQRRALAAASAVSDLLKQSGIAIVAGRDRLYRAQLTSLNAERAERICDALKARNFDCVTLSPSRAQAATLAFDQG
ncbi:MAG: D-alanyl-D-alanine carboxypeptidase family protein [Alphaproteobacteria bacterium]|jgi:D-alanyl-D-alanine carboxypeptidase|nr:D-alanyl-D-alanine carboxypeptidase family protein [Alphaproteobacteria bacterium]